MTEKFDRGFKSNCERLAQEIRVELGLNLTDPFDPRVFAKSLAIPIYSLSDLLDDCEDPSSVQHFLRAGKADFSAMTVFSGSRRLIVENPAHSDGRRANSLAHELSHVILEHEPAPALDAIGCRHWSQKQEQEADWLGGVLLIPREAALHILRRSLPSAEACTIYGVSSTLLNWRINHSGARHQFDRATAIRRAKK